LLPHSLVVRLTGQQVICSRGGGHKRADWTTQLMMKNRERKHRRRSVAVMVAVAASLGSSHSVVTSAAAEKYIDRQHSNNKINLRRRRPLELSQLEIRHHRRIENTDSRCQGSSLKPGGILQQNEFICDGQLRFGIDFRGRFILGFATNETDITPDMIAWQAKPTSLFVDDERPFGFIRLAEDGSILGFDLLYDEIYDSNYDYRNREQGKEYYSSLLLSNDCVVAESVQPGTFCVTLTSQAKPGMPNGMTTWGVKVDTDTMISFEPPSSSPTSPLTLQPSQQVTSVSATEESVAGIWDPTYSSSVPTIRLTPSPSYAPSITPSTSSLQIGSQSKKTIIYGYVWQDEDQDGKMGREETRLGDFEVKFYECVANGRVSAAGSVRTDVEGLYFIQLPYGEYRAFYEVDQNTYGYSAGVQYSNSGWTDCMSSSKTIIVSNVGLYTKDAVAPLADVTSAEAIIFDDIPSFPQVAEAATEAAAESPAMLELAKIEPVKLSSIAGFVYMDTNNNKIMDPDERSIAVKGYTVGDGIVKVSLIDCQPANSVLPSVKFVPFPGHYMFGNLTEGSYKLKFELISVDPNATITSMYTFIDGTNQVSASRETQCGKLGQGQDNDQGDVGVQAVKLPLQGEMETESASTEFPFVSKPGVRTVNEDGSGNADVSGIIGGVVVAFVLIAAVAFIVRKHQPSKLISLGQGHKDGIESRGNLGLSMDADISTTSDGGSTLVDRPTIGMHVVEEEFDDNDSESSSSSSSSSSESESDDDDDDDDSRQSSVDYGPVVSNIIAQYSQQQQQQQHNMIEAHTQDDHHLQYHGGYYNDPSNQHYQQQHYQSQYHHDQYDSASTFSNNSSDPPAASYTSLPHQNELVDQEGYEVQYEKHLSVQSDSDSESSVEESGGNIIFSSVPPQTSTGTRSRSNPRDDRDSSSWKKEAIPENSTIVFNSHQIRERTTSPHIDDSKSVISTGSDQSADPPGMSYKDTHFDQYRAPPPRQKGNRGRSVPPPPPRKFPSPQQQRYISPQQQRLMSSQQQRYASPQEQRHLSPSSGRFSTYHPSQDK